MSYCHGLGGNQVFAYTKRQQVCLHSLKSRLQSDLLQVMSDDNCLDAAGAEGPVKLVRCHGMGGNQAWVFNKMDNSLRHVNTGKCLTTQTQDPGNMMVGRKTVNRLILTRYFSLQAVQSWSPAVGRHHSSGSWRINLNGKLAALNLRSDYVSLVPSHQPA